MHHMPIARKADAIKAPCILCMRLAACLVRRTTLLPQHDPSAPLPFKSGLLKAMPGHPPHGRSNSAAQRSFKLKTRAGRRICTYKVFNAHRECRFGEQNPCDSRQSPESANYVTSRCACTSAPAWLEAMPTCKNTCGQVSAPAPLLCTAAWARQTCVDGLHMH